MVDLELNTTATQGVPDNEHYSSEKKHGDEPGDLAEVQRSTSMPTEGELADEDDSPDGKYPEGGLRAWLVVLGAWCALFPSMGLLNTIGILHAWTADHQLASYSSSSIGWIYGAFAFFLYFGSAQVGMYCCCHSEFANCWTDFW